MTRKQGGDEPGLSEMADLVTPMAIRVAATLRVADHITRGLCSADEMARAAGVSEHLLERVLRHLVAVEVLRRDESGRYSLCPRGERLRSDHASGLCGALDIHGALGRAELSFVHLLESVQTGEASFERLYGRSFWDDLGSDPARTDSYDQQMGSDVALWAREIAPAYDWGSLAHVVDVGGGNGTLLAALLGANPQLRGTVFDQPQSADAARALLRAAGLEARSDVASGSFFESLPPGAGGYILCAILHDWDDAAARAILARCAEASGAAGRVFVIEKTGADGESPRTDMDLRMLAYFGARERGVEAISALASDSGLRTVAVHPAGDLSIVELSPRPTQ